MLGEMNDKYMPALSTRRLLLRRLAMADAQDIYDYSCDEQVARYVLWSPHRSLADSRAFLRYVLRQYRAADLTATYCIEEKATSRVVGTIGLAAYSPENSVCELGYSLARDCWGRGYMTEALGAMLYYSFEYLGLNRAEAMHDVRNPASGRVMEKCGMHMEGLLRGKLYSKGEYIDVRLYALTRGEYERSDHEWPDLIYKRAKLF